MALYTQQQYLNHGGPGIPLPSGGGAKVSVPAVKRAVLGNLGLGAAGGFKVKPPKTAGPKVALPPDPFAPLTQAQINQQAQAAVKVQIDPLLANLAAGEAQRLGAGGAAISGYTNSMASQLAKYQDQSKASYAGAEASQAANDNALRALLTGGGAQAASQLSSTLAGSPVANEAAAGAAAQATGAANAGYAQGSASLAQLIAQAAADQEYGRKLPGFATQQGLDELRNLADQSQQYVASGRADIMAKVPGLIQTLVDNANNRELSKANSRFQQQLAVDNNLLNTRKVNQAYAKLQADLKLAHQRLLEQTRHNQATEGTSGKNAQTAAQRAAEQRRHDRATEAKKKAPVSAPWNKKPAKP